VRKGGVVSSINSDLELLDADAWAMPLANRITTEAFDWAKALAEVAAAIALEKGVAAPVAVSFDGDTGATAKAIAASLMGGERKAILLGNAAAHHVNASSLLALANWIAEQTGASIGFLTEAANTVGAQLAGALPNGEGLNAGQMLDGQLKAVMLFGNEPAYDSANPAQSLAGINQAQMVVTLSPFKANMRFSDVLLPISPFTETPGTFVNAEGRVQSFHAVTKPMGDTRPGWKVLRVLANLLELPGFAYETAADVLAQIPGANDTHIAAERLGNGTLSRITLDNPAQPPSALGVASSVPAVASIYQLDSLVRRATSLQLTTDAQKALPQSQSTSQSDNASAGVAA
jgi:NADH-quinone oxidoreductase subunit G